MAPQQNSQGSVISARTESHSDVATSKPARALQQATTETQLGRALVARLRQVEGPLRLGELQEEWLETDDGMVHELKVELLDQ